MYTSASASKVARDKDAKRRGKYAPPSVTSFNIRCSGKIHRVSVNWRGRIKFHNHTKDELKALRVFGKLGDTQCGCLEVIMWMKDKYEPAKKPEMRDLWKEVRSVKFNRTKNREEVSTSKSITLDSRRDSIRSIMSGRDFASKLVYPGASDSGPYGHMGPGSGKRVYFDISAGPRLREEPSLIQGKMLMTYSTSGKWKSGEFKVEIRVPIIWSAWYKYGVGVVQGLVVTDIKDKDWSSKDVLTVEVGRCVESKLGRPEIVPWLAKISRVVTTSKKRTYPTPTNPTVTEYWKVTEWVFALGEPNEEKLPQDVYKPTHPL